MSLDCVQCYGGDVNPSTHLSFVGVCHTCPKGHRIVYSWELYYVESPSSLIPFDVLEKMTCADPSGVGWSGAFLGRNHTGTPITITTVTPTTRQMSDIARAPTGTLKITRKCYRSGQKSTTKPATMPSRRHPSYTKGASHGSRRGSGVGSGSGTRIRWGSGKGFFSESPTRPCGSGSGSAPGLGRRSTSSPITGVASGTRFNSDSGCRSVTGSAAPPNLDTPATESSKEGSVFDGDFVPNSALKTHNVIRLPKRKLRLFPAKTLYGTRETSLGVRENIIIKPRFLRTGQQYLLAFKAQDTQNKTKEGLASLYFSVNVNPERGSCVISPEMGTEMDTDFTLGCSGWSDRVSLIELFLVLCCNSCFSSA